MRRHYLPKLDMNCRFGLEICTCPMLKQLVRQSLFSPFEQDIQRRPQFGIIGSHAGSVSTAQYAAAMKRRRALTEPEWLQSCDELAQQQLAMFLELLTLARDGVQADVARRVIDYLSALQYCFDTAEWSNWC